MGLTHEQLAVNFMPDVIEFPWESEITCENRVHDLLSGEPYITLGNPSTRTGQVSYVFTEASDAEALHAAHRTKGTWLLDADLPGGALRYVADSARLTQRTGGWVVAVTYTEAP